MERTDRKAMNARNKPMKITGSAITKHTDTSYLFNDWPEIERETRLLEAAESFDNLVDVIGEGRE